LGMWWLNVLRSIFWIHWISLLHMNFYTPDIICFKFVNVCVSLHLATLELYGDLKIMKIYTVSNFEEIVTVAKGQPILALNLICFNLECMSPNTGPRTVKHCSASTKSISLSTKSTYTKFMLSWVAAIHFQHTSPK
jgi:hypothetical protein